MTSLTSNLQESSASPNYTFVFDFERNFEYGVKRQWMLANWHHSFYYSCIYVVLIFGGQAYMKSRTKFDLRKALFLWSALLAVFSMIGVSRTLPEVIHVLKQYGFSYSVCNASFIRVTKVSGFWAWIFTLSKFVELGDTMFIVLRKQKLMFLHWYHHITVMLYTWYSYEGPTSASRWYIVINFSVHSMMYTYYALTALRIKVPRVLAILITTSQITQMVAGLYITSFAFITKRKGEVCQMPEDVIIYGLLIYASYLVLFVRFFYGSYVSTPSKTQKLK